MMDGWHGDEYECNGHCSCEECQKRLDTKADSDYDGWVDDELFGSNSDE